MAAELRRDRIAVSGGGGGKVEGEVRHEEEGEDDRESEEGRGEDEKYPRPAHSSCPNGRTLIAHGMTLDRKK